MFRIPRVPVGIKLLFVVLNPTIPNPDVRSEASVVLNHHCHEAVRAFTRFGLALLAILNDCPTSLWRDGILRLFKLTPMAFPLEVSVTDSLMPLHCIAFEHAFATVVAIMSGNFLGFHSIALYFALMVACNAFSSAVAFAWSG